MTVLIVDDNLGVRRMLRTILSDVATTVFEAADGAEGVHTYHALQPDVVLMDIRLPGMDGLSAMREILRVQPEAKVVVLTDLDHDDMRSAATQAGAYAFVSKQDLTGLPSLLRDRA